MASIVIIEKDESLASVMETALKEAGHAVEKISEPAEVVEIMYQVHPELVILSEDLSKVEREDFCMRIRKASYLPIILIGSKDNAAEALESGFDVHISRPPDICELVARVQSLIRRKSDFTEK